MPNGGSDCCGTCWFNRANGGERGHADFKIPSHCEIRQLEISNPYYTYCANHPHHRPNRDPIPIGPVYVVGGMGPREVWQPSPDTEEIRQHLLHIVREPKEHSDAYPFYAEPPHKKAIQQMVDFGDERVVEALEELAQRDEVQKARANILSLIEEVRQKLAERRA